jgi:hypothetical protein
MYDSIGAERVVAAGILSAVEPGILPGGRVVRMAFTAEDGSTAPGGKMPPSAAGKMPAAT